MSPSKCSNRPRIRPITASTLLIPTNRVRIEIGDIHRVIIRVLVHIARVPAQVTLITPRGTVSVLRARVDAVDVVWRVCGEEGEGACTCAGDAAAAGGALDCAAVCGIVLVAAWVYKAR